MEETDEQENGEGLEQALEHDRRLLRRRLLEVIERPEAREAIFVASPELESGIAAWKKDPSSKKGRRAEQALVRYFLRMASRATPFGLFSGCSLGEVAEGPSRLRLGELSAYRRHTRLDMDYLFALCEGLGQDPEVRAVLRYRPSSSLYRAAGRLRYAEARLQGTSRAYHLVGVDSAPYLEACLERAREGATVAELAESLVAALADDPDGGVDLEEAEEFVHELIDCQLLVSELGPVVSGVEPIHELIAQMEELPPLSPVALRLRETRDALASLDAHGPGADPARYLEVAERLRELPTRVELPRLFQVDLIKPALEARLGADLISEVENGLKILHLLGGGRQEDPIETFRNRFLERYEDSRLVPLMEALDDEIGIGFDKSEGSDGGAAPLLDGLALQPPAEDSSVRWTTATALLLRKLERAFAEGASEIEISSEDLRRLAERDGALLPALPDALQAIVEVSAGSEESLDHGELELHLRGAHGPSGARLLGRFCHADPVLHRWVKEHLRAEQTLRPDAVFAEVIHLPEGRIGNILCRPVLRRYEIPFLGRSGAPPEQQLPLDDLRVTVQGSEVVLYSRRLGRQVLPRLTSAHNFTQRSLGVYRFLCMLQAQGARPMLSWSWGALEGCAFLPRVRCGRLVLTRARWRVSGDEVTKLADSHGAARYRKVQQWRQRLGLPRWVQLVDGDNELPVDLENVLSLVAFLSAASRRAEVVLAELSPGDGELWAEGPEGRFVHELVIPFVANAAPTPRRAGAESARTGSAHSDSNIEASRTAGRAAPPTVRRLFPPGSEWLYAKLYTGTATADRLLAEAVAPIRQQALESGAADGWLFLRYGDPDWHLRLRFHGDPRRLNGEVLPRLQAAAAQVLEDGRLHRFQIDTYERELERYGGPAAIELAEAFFAVDSDAVLALVLSLEGDEGAVARWQLTLLGIDLLLEDLGFDEAGKRRLVERIQQGSAREFRIDAHARRQLADRLRSERKGLETLLSRDLPPDHPLAPGVAILEQRSSRLQPIFTELRRREAAGLLIRPVEDLAPSYAHMFANRLLRSDGRLQEMVIYDFLHRLYLSRAARERAARKPRKPKKGG
ncbi:MAG: lantibiotic dehydratase [Holophagales bacterium]|nr:lantibiotic dehydratase [Holophagales bacterium]